MARSDNAASLALLRARARRAVAVLDAWTAAEDKAGITADTPERDRLAADAQRAVDDFIAASADGAS